MTKTFKLLCTMNGHKDFTLVTAGLSSLDAAVAYASSSNMLTVPGVSTLAVVSSTVKPDKGSLYTANHVKKNTPWMCKVTTKMPVYKTVEDLAKDAGLKNFDYAVPHDWMMEGIKLTGLNMGVVVWSYDDPGLFGRPVALDHEGEAFLAAYDAATGNTFYSADKFAEMLKSDAAPVLYAPGF